MKREPIVYASDCVPCSGCDEPYCLKHERHYAECSCLGPMEAGELQAEQLGVVLQTPEGEFFEWDGEATLEDLRAKLP